MAISGIPSRIRSRGSGGPGRSCGRSERLEIYPGSPRRTCSTCCSARPVPIVMAGVTGTGTRSSTRSPTRSEAGLSKGARRTPPRRASCERSRRSRTGPRKTPERSRSSTRPAAADTSCSTASPCCWSSTRRLTTIPTWGLGCRQPTRRRLTCGRHSPGLILRHNLHGIDIDLRCTQIAALGPLAALPAGLSGDGHQEGSTPHQQVEHRVRRADAWRRVHAQGVRGARSNRSSWGNSSRSSSIR